jgi:hypothetical protein
MSQIEGGFEWGDFLFYIFFRRKGQKMEKKKNLRMEWISPVGTIRGMDNPKITFKIHYED